MITGRIVETYLRRLGPLPADRHQDVVGRGSRGGRGGAAGQCCGPALRILAWRTLKVIVTPTNHWCLAAWTQTNRHVQTETWTTQEKWQEEKFPLCSVSP